MTFEIEDAKLCNAIKILQKEYAKAKQNPIIESPINYALYQAWEYMDRKHRQELQKHTCGECTRFADLHSSCNKVRYLIVDENSKACENFKESKKWQEKD